MKRKQHMFSNEYVLKKISKKEGASLYVILPKSQLKMNNLGEGDSIILEAYKWVDE